MSDIASNRKIHRMIPLRNVLIPIAIILVAVVLFILVAALSPKPEKKPPIVKAPLVEVAMMVRENIAFEVASQGSLLPRTQTQMISEVSGQIIEVSPKFNVGGFFTQGEVLLQIDDSSYQVALLQAQSQIDAANAVLIEQQARAKQAEDEWLLSGKPLVDAPILALRLPQLQKAKADVKAAQAQVIDAQVKLARTKITAPYDAMVSAKQVDIGQYVTTGSTLATVFAIDYAEVRLPIKQKDIEFLNLPKINQMSNDSSSVELYYKLMATKYSWQSRLTRYEGVVDSRNRVHYVVAQIDDPYGLLSSSSHQQIRIGTFVNAIITGKEVNDIIAIPRSAVHGENNLYLVDGDNKLHIKKIDIVRGDANTVFTHDNFVPELRLVLTQLQTPIAGMTLRIIGEQDLTSENPPQNANKAQDDKDKGDD